MADMLKISDDQYFKYRYAKPGSVVRYGMDRLLMLHRASMVKKEALHELLNYYTGTHYYFVELEENSGRYLLGIFKRLTKSHE